MLRARMRIALGAFLVAGGSWAATVALAQSAVLAGARSHAINPDVPAFAAPSGGITPTVRGNAVYTMTNAAEGNEIVVFDRRSDGQISLRTRVSTGGRGSGASLGNQSGLIMSDDGRWLLAVNAGSNDVSLLSIQADTSGSPTPPSPLQLVSVTRSDGSLPTSVTMHGSLVYVLNAGGPGNVSGFELSTGGTLETLTNSTRLLGGRANAQPAQVGFNPAGDVLVVTDKTSNTITTFTVGTDGRLSSPIPQPASGKTPFGFAFLNDVLVVAEAFSGEANMSAVSSYMVGTDGKLTLISGSVPTLQSATCWVAIGNKGRSIYTTNTDSGTISQLALTRAGAVRPIAGNSLVEVGEDQSAPIDIAQSEDGHFLYVLAAGTGEIVSYSVNPLNGSLTHVQTMPGLPMSVDGLAAR